MKKTDTLPHPPRHLNFHPDAAASAQDFERRLGEARRRIEAAVGSSATTLVRTLELVGEDLDRRFAALRHLNAVRASAQTRSAYERALAAYTEFETWLGQHPKLYRIFRNLAKQRGFARRPAAERALVQHALADFQLSGAELPRKERECVRRLIAELAQFGNRFEAQLLDATDAWQLPVREASALTGLATDIQAALAERARETGQQGWLLTLDAAVVDTILKQSANRDLRREVYEAWISRASDVGPHAGRFDNGPVIKSILERRYGLAEATGFANYAEYALTERMARSAQEVVSFLRELAARARPRAQEQLEELQRFARTRGLREPLAAWDLAYYSEQLRAERFGLDEETLRHYFPLTRVLGGLRNLFRRMYGIRFRTNRRSATWHPDVITWDLVDAGGRPLGRLYLDLHARPAKRAGAWMDEGGHRVRLAGVERLPIGFLTANFLRAAPGRPSLLTHDDVITLCHEFGHCLHHLLSRINYPSVSGINGVEWDAVEFPSQLHEEFAWHPRGLALLAAEAETGEPLPDGLVAALGASRRFQAAMRLMRQIEFALFDIELHASEPAMLGADPAGRVLAAVRHEVRVAPLSPLDRTASSFAHVFGGGYAAGYYGYLWAEVMARDAFGVFLARGQLLPAAGHRLRREVLAVGGSRSARVSYRRFRGRDPDPEALLLAYGMG